MPLTEPATVRDDITTALGAPRRSLITRLSIGHVVMILAGLVAILLNLAFLRTGADTVNVAVAARTMEAGTVLSQTLLDSVEVAEVGKLAQGLLTDDAFTGLYGSVLARDIQAGEPIRRSDLRPAGSSLALREYSIEVEAASAAGGSIQDTDIVDIIAVIDNQAFYVAAGLEVVRVSGDNAEHGGADLIIVLSVDDRTALEIESARSSGPISVVRATGAPSPVSGPVVVNPSARP
jgi:Flp pilus assembly protein CpaB